MIEPVPLDALTEFTDSIRIFRTDRLTTKCCGNKQFKLSRNLQRLKQSGASGVLSFGGVWSNHLHAFAIACEELHLRAVAVVRGDSSSTTLLLNNAVQHGLSVHCVSRSDYRKRHDEVYVQTLMSELHCDAWLPEGGSNKFAVEGCRKIAAMVNACVAKPPACLALAVGTGATMAGIIAGANKGQIVVGVPVVQDSRIESDIENWIGTQVSADWRLLDTAHPPRYGKVDHSLLEFVLQVYSDTGVILDPVYNAKALRSVLQDGSDSERQHECVFIHTGGLGGCLGFAPDLLAIDTRLAAGLLSEVAGLLGITE